MKPAFSIRFKVTRQLPFRLFEGEELDNEDSSIDYLTGNRKGCFDTIEVCVEVRIPAVPKGIVGLPFAVLAIRDPERGGALFTASYLQR